MSTRYFIECNLMFCEIYITRKPMACFAGVLNWYLLSLFPLSTTPSPPPPQKKKKKSLGKRLGAHQQIHLPLFIVKVEQ